MFGVVSGNDRRFVRRAHQPTDGLPDGLRTWGDFLLSLAPVFERNKLWAAQSHLDRSVLCGMHLKSPHAMQLCMREPQFAVVLRANSRQNATECDSLDEMYFFQRALNSSR